MHILPARESSSGTCNQNRDSSPAVPPTAIAQQIAKVSTDSHAMPPARTSSIQEPCATASELLQELHLSIYLGQSGDSAIRELDANTRSELAILNDYFQHDSITEEGQKICTQLRAEARHPGTPRRRIQQGFRFLPRHKMKPRLCYRYEQNPANGQYQLHQTECRTHIEAQLVWANLTQQQRNDWTMSGYADHFKMRLSAWYKETNQHGQLLTHWTGLGKGWHDGSAARFTPETLLAIQRAYRDPSATPGRVLQTPSWANVSSQLIKRYLLPDGDFSPLGARFMSLARLAQAGPRAMEQRLNIVRKLRHILSDQRSESTALRSMHQHYQDKLSLLTRLFNTCGLTPAGRLLISNMQGQSWHPVRAIAAAPGAPAITSRRLHWLGAPKTFSQPPVYTSDICCWTLHAPSQQLVRIKAHGCVALDLQLAWASLRQEQRAAWSMQQFAKRFRVSPIQWRHDTNMQGHLLRHWSQLNDGWHNGSARPLTPELLRQLQQACHFPSVRPCFRPYLAQKHGISYALLERYIAKDGTLTAHGERYFTLMQSAIAGPQPMLVPPSPHELLQLLYQVSNADASNTPAPSSPPAASGRIRRASTPVSCEIADKQIKPDLEAPLQRIVHEPQHTLPVLQAPVQPQSSLLEQQGLVDMIEVSEWYEMDEVLAAFPPRQKIKVKQRITREIRSWLTPGMDHESRFGQKFDVAEDLTQDRWSGRGLFARTDIRQFEVLGPYAGSLHEQVGPDLPTLITARRQQGAGRVLEYSWTTAAGNVISGYRTGNLLSLMNTAAMSTCTGTSALAPVNNVAAIAFGRNFIFYVAKQDIKKGSQLLVNYGSAYNPHAHTVKEDPEAAVQNQ